MSDCNGCGGAPTYKTERDILMDQVTAEAIGNLSIEQPKIYICWEWEFKDKLVWCYPFDERLKNGVYSHIKTVLL